MCSFVIFLIHNYMTKKWKWICQNAKSGWQWLGRIWVVFLDFDAVFSLKERHIWRQTWARENGVRIFELFKNSRGDSDVQRQPCWAGAWGIVKRSWSLEPEVQRGFKLISTVHQLCDLKQVTQPLRTSVPSSIKQEYCKFNKDQIKNLSAWCCIMLFHKY